MDRRDVLRAGWKIGGLLLGAAAGWTGYEALRPLAGASIGGRLKLGRADEVGRGSARYVTGGRLWLANADGNLFALSQRCPHLGCRVPFCESSGRFECPCHGSVFDIDGAYIAGPSPRGMDRYELSLDGNELVADLDRLIAGPDKSDTSSPRSPRGPACVEEG